jgi:hypothetical protein
MQKPVSMRMVVQPRRTTIRMETGFSVVLAASPPAQ